ncbi:unnamed protein product [Caenorhabditis angaria]|uniref:Uncharacterized protein n=1 Tax=Caenorhabditis angaria TaxID=860376 RepID=A0A9P1ILL6_9PELO|nr:unnamed protein product [Caenorhabditis angaria]
MVNATEVANQAGTSNDSGKSGIQRDSPTHLDITVFSELELIATSNHPKSTDIPTSRNYLLYEQELQVEMEITIVIKEVQKPTTSGIYRSIHNSWKIRDPAG